MILANTTQITKNTTLHVIDIKVICQSFANFIDRHIVKICEGDSGTELAITKENLRKFLQTKDIRTCHGAVAEFFVHLYLNSLGYKQEFLYLNLEEGSIKKGLDGYFSFNSQEFLVESKSGASTSINISHKNKLSEAYEDLNSAVSGASKKGKNNLWRNAYNHASHADVKADTSIRAKLKILSDLYDQGSFKKISDFNIIPCSTIFIEGGWNDKFTQETDSLDVKYFSKFNAKTTNAICITKSTYDTFLKYLKD